MNRPTICLRSRSVRLVLISLAALALAACPSPSGGGGGGGGDTLSQQGTIARDALSDGLSGSLSQDDIDAIVDEAVGSVTAGSQDSAESILSDLVSGAQRGVGGLGSLSDAEREAAIEAIVSSAVGAIGAMDATVSSSGFTSSSLGALAPDPSNRAVIAGAIVAASIGELDGAGFSNADARAAAADNSTFSAAAALRDAEIRSDEVEGAISEMSAGAVSAFGAAGLDASRAVTVARDASASIIAAIDQQPVDGIDIALDIPGLTRAAASGGVAALGIVGISGLDDAQVAALAAAITEGTTTAVRSARLDTSDVTALEATLGAVVREVSAAATAALATAQSSASGVTITLTSGVRGIVNGTSRGVNEYASEFGETISVGTVVEEVVRGASEGTAILAGGDDTLRGDLESAIQSELDALREEIRALENEIAALQDDIARLTALIESGRAAAANQAPEASLTVVVGGTTAPGSPFDNTDGPFIDAEVGQTIELNGSASTDPDGTDADLDHDWFYEFGATTSLSFYDTVGLTGTPVIPFQGIYDTLYLQFSRPGDYYFRLSVDDGEDEDEVFFVMRVAPAGGGTVTNTAPVASARSETTLGVAATRFDLGDTVVLDGTESSDPDTGHTLTYHWTLDFAPSGSAFAAGSQQSTNAEFDFVPDAAGQYFFALIVDDGLAIDEAFVSITVVDPNAGGGGTANFVYGGTLELYDGTSYSANGNGNGTLEAGESVRMDLLIQNTGDGEATNVEGYITTSEPDVTITEGGSPTDTAYFDDRITAGRFDSLGDSVPDATSGNVFLSPTSSATRFAFTLANSATPPPSVTFTLNLSDDAGNAWTTDVTIPVAANQSDLVYGGAYEIYDTTSASFGTTGDGDGQPTPNETFRMDIAVQHTNPSGATARGVTATLSVASGSAVPASEVAISDATQTYGTIRANYFDSLYESIDRSDFGTLTLGATSSSRYLVALAGTISPGSTITFQLDFEDDLGNTWSDTFDLPVGGTTISMIYGGTFDINDTISGSYSTFGNGDGAVNLNETFRMDVAVQNSNTGTSEAQGVTATLSVAPSSLVPASAITITDATQTYGDIPANYFDSLYESVARSSFGTLQVSANSSTRYLVAVDGTPTPGNPITFQLDFTDTAGNSWTDTFDVPLVEITTGMAYGGEYDINDTLSGSYLTEGDSDGRLSPGETVRIDVAVTNESASDIIGVDATFSLVSPPANVTLTDATWAYGNVGAGKFDSLYETANRDSLVQLTTSANSSSRPLISVGQGVATGQDLTVQIDFTDDLGNTWSDTFLIPIEATTVTMIYGGELAITDQISVSYGTDGNNNGEANLGETVRFDVALQNSNTGTSNAIGVSATLSVASGSQVPAGLVTITDATQPYGTATAPIGPNRFDSLYDSPRDTLVQLTTQANSSSRFGVTFDSSITSGQVVTFQLDITDYFGNSWTDTFDVTVIDITTTASVFLEGTFDAYDGNSTSYVTAAGVTNNNNNGVIEQGEVIRFDFRIGYSDSGPTSNVGDIDATITNVSAGGTLITDGPTSAATQTYSGPMDAGEYDSLYWTSAPSTTASNVIVSATGSNRYLVEFAVGAGSPVTLDFLFEDRFGNQWTDSIDIIVAAP